MNEFAEELMIQETFDITKLNDHAKKQYERGMAIHQAIDNGFERLRRTSWEDLTISGANIGTTFFLDCVIFNLVGKTIGLLANCSKFGFAKYNEMVSVKLPELARALQQKNPLTQPFLVEMAGVEKIFVEHGPEVLQKTLETIQHNPGLVTQEGKSVSQILKEVSGDVAKNTVPTTALVQEGKVVEQLSDVSGNINEGVTGYTRHGLNQVIGRDGGKGVSPKAILDAVKNPIEKIEQIEGKIKYVGTDAVVVLNKDGKLITAYAKSSEGLRGGV